jgi:hypothetical protein
LDDSVPLGPTKRAGREPVEHFLHVGRNQWFHLEILGPEIDRRLLARMKCSVICLSGSMTPTLPSGT